MGQNKHVGLEINIGHGQLDKTFNKDYKQSFCAVCLAGISSFYITTCYYTTAVASHVTKASNVTQSSRGSRLRGASCCPAHAVFPTKVFDDQVVGYLLLCVHWLHSHSLAGKQDKKALEFQGKKNTSFHLLACWFFF